MKRSLGLRPNLGGSLALGVLVACAELRDAPPGVDAGASDASTTTKIDGSTSGTAESHDASADAGRATCPAPCDPEQLSKLDNLGPVVVDSFNVYFGSANGGVWKVTKSVEHKLTKLGDGKATRLALANDRVWWGEGDHLVACATGGCSGIPEGLLLDQTGIDEVMTDGTKIVWHAHVGANDVIRACPAQNCSGGSVAGVTSDVLSPRAGMGIGAKKVFWVDLQSKLNFCPLDRQCDAPTVFADGSNDATVSGDTVFWVYAQNVVSCSVTSCTTPKKIGTSQTPHLLVADESDIYWREMVDNKVLRCPIDGCKGDPEEIANEVDGVYYGGLALDAEYVYWTSKSGLWRRRK